MFASRLFWKLFSAYTVLTVLSAAGFVLVVSQRQQFLLEAQHQRRLHDVAVVLADSLSGSFPEKPSEAWQHKLANLAKDTEARLSLIDPEGTVIADSDFDPLSMENHANRPEILQAGTGKVGLARRESPTLEIPMMYVAVPITADGQTHGFVRVAADMATIDAQSAALRTRLFLVAALVSLIAVLLTYLIVARIVQPLLTLTNAAQAIAQGEAMQTVDLPHRDEIGMLAMTGRTSRDRPRRRPGT
jgi:two-component system phosphate regulon sensor histidine kinase PhoR